MSRCNTIIAATLAAAALAAPTALAQAPDIHQPLIEEAKKQDLRSPDARDAARAMPSDRNAARPETAGNPNVTTAADRALAQERYYMSNGKNAATDNIAPTADPALAWERYYASLGKRTPLTNATRTVAADTGEGIAPLPFVMAVFGALIVGLGAGSGLHLLHARRHAARLAT
jgi:hypothetical protein